MGRIREGDLEFSEALDFVMVETRSCKGLKGNIELITNNYAKVRNTT